MPIAKADQRYTYNDYITWDDNERWEIIDGVAYSMAPAPNLAHQNTVLAIGSFLNHALKNKQCKVFIAPTDVVFSATDIVQPDIAVVCDPEKLKNGKNIQGAPDLIIEVLSPYTEVKDRREKKALYEKYGVKEYLLVNPAAYSIGQYRWMDHGQFDLGSEFHWDQSVSLKSIEGIILKLKELFDTKPEPRTPPKSGSTNAAESTRYD